jgi:hypothetical protein
MSSGPKDAPESTRACTSDQQEQAQAPYRTPALRGSSGARARRRFFFPCNDEEEHTLSGLEERGRDTYRDGSLSRAVFHQPEEESSL